MELLFSKETEKNIADERSDSLDTIPNERVICVQDASEEKGAVVEFRLIYRGKLPAAGRADGRSREKHEIRRHLHPQIKNLWREHPALKNWETMTGSAWKTAVRNMADRNERCGHRFLPLVSPDWGLDCTLDILFLRRDQPGSYLVSGGDLDNRLKVLFDALKVPKDCDDAIRSWKAEEDEDPLYCLLQDDSLISEIKVTTDRLLLPLEEEEKLSHVVLIVHVKTRIVNMDKAYIEML